jgi:malonyl-CoA/methylmalonyl-CoA synthetase
MKNWLYDGLMPKTRNNGQSVFLSTSDGSQLTYQQLEHSTAQAANALLSLGVQPDDRIAVQIDKSVDGIIIYLAALRVGAVFLPLNTAYVTAELDYFLTNATPVIFICDPNKVPSLNDLLSVSELNLMTLNSKGQGSWKDLVELQSNSFANIERNADDLAAILYTSGTTGVSKGAMLSHDNLLSNAKALTNYWHYKSSDVLLHALPIYHTHGLFVAINVTLLATASIIYLERFDTKTICQQLPNATVLMGVPTFYTRLLQYEKFNAITCTNMRLFISGSAPLLAEDHQRFKALTGKVILERYGMTETNMNTSNPYQAERRAGTVGLPLPSVEIRIIDQKTGHQCEADEIGMIEVKGPNVFKGYWKMPKKTAEEFTDDGYFVTGDLGLVDSDGYMSIVGREKDLIITGGLNVYPKDVELIINQCKGVIESAVIGIADPDYGEKVVAVIVSEVNFKIEESDSNNDKLSNEKSLNKKLSNEKLFNQKSPNEKSSNEKSPNEKLSNEIRLALEKNLAKYKHPKQLIYVNYLPRNTMGKVQKNKLRESYSIK